VVEADSETESTHLLLVVVQDNEIAINTIVLCDQVKQGYPYVTQSEEVLSLHLIIKHVCASPQASLILFTKVVTHFENSPLRLKIVKDLSVHLSLHLISLLEDWVKAVIEHTGRLLGLWESLQKIIIFIEDRRQNDEVHAVLEDLSQDFSTIDGAIATSIS